MTVHRHLCLVSSSKTIIADLADPCRPDVIIWTVNKAFAWWPDSIGASWSSHMHSRSGMWPDLPHHSMWKSYARPPGAIPGGTCRRDVHTVPDQGPIRATPYKSNRMPGPNMHGHAFTNNQPTINELSKALDFIGFPGIWNWWRIGNWCQYARQCMIAECHETGTIGDPYSPMLNGRSMIRLQAVACNC